MLSHITKANLPQRSELNNLAPIAMESPQCSQALKRKQRGLGVESGTQSLCNAFCFASKKITLLIKLFLVGCFCCIFVLALPAQSTWNEVYTILKSNCATAGCHAGANPAGLLYFDLEKHFVHEQIFNQFPQNETAAQSNNRLVYAGDPYRSYIFRKLNKGFAKDAPLSEGELDEHHSNTLTKVEKELVRQWILFGAPDSGLVVKREMLEDFYSGNGIQSVEEAPEPPKTPKQGYQIHVGPYFLPPGAEQEYFYKYPLDNLNEKIEVVAFDTKMGSGSHHFIMMKFWKSFINKTANGLREWDRHDHATFEEVAQESQRIELPKGSAFEWSKGTVLDLNTHYINYSSSAVLACDVYINVETQATGTAKQVMYTQLIPDTTIVIPPGGERVELVDTFSINLPLANLYIWSLTSHAHSASIDYDIYEIIPNKPLNHIYDASCPGGIPGCLNGFYDYESPPTRYFNPFFKANPVTGAVHKVTYVNNGTEPLKWNWTSSGEMMVFVMRYLIDTVGVEMLLDPALAIDEDMLNNYMSEMAIYPNPTNGILQIENGEMPSAKDLHIYNLYGVLIKTTKLKKGQNSVNLNYLSKGVYMMNLINEMNGQAYAQKIIVQ